jgi:hypothetical protein
VSRALRTGGCAQARTRTRPAVPVTPFVQAMPRPTPGYFEYFFSRLAITTGHAFSKYALFFAQSGPSP